MVISVAIDGPAGVGKSTVSKLLAQKLGWNCLDTGALYRAFTVECLNLGLDFNNKKDIESNIDKIAIDVKFINNEQRVFVNDKDVTSIIRKEIIDKNVPFISKIKKVRESIKHIQRKIAIKNNVVVEGRDIGSVILHDTINKFFLSATPEVRAERRYKERLSRGENVSYDEILKDINARDKIDMEREISPLIICPDSIVVDTNNMNVQEVTDFIFKRVRFK